MLDASTGPIATSRAGLKVFFNDIVAIQRYEKHLKEKLYDSPFESRKKKSKITPPKLISFF